jgi:hypothetical protein
MLSREIKGLTVKIFFAGKLTDVQEERDASRPFPIVAEDTC